MLEELGLESVENIMQKYKFNCLNHISKMENNRIIKLMMSYETRRHRRPGGRLRRLLDGVETGLQTVIIRDR